MQLGERGSGASGLVVEEGQVLIRGNNLSEEELEGPGLATR